jgi:hypothetical protein
MISEKALLSLKDSVRRIERLLEEHTILGFNDRGNRQSLFLNPNPEDGHLWYIRNDKRNSTPIQASSLTAYLENAWRYHRADGTARLHVQLAASAPILLQIGMATQASLTLLAALLELEQHAFDPAATPITIYPVRADQGRTTFLRVRAAGRVIISDQSRNLDAAEALKILSSRYGFFDPYQP